MYLKPVFLGDLPSDQPVIGLNTGCGERWPTRLWEDGNWANLAKLLIEHQFHPVLLGGAQEHEKNMRIQELSNANYLNHHPLSNFIDLVNHCDLIVTQVTMTLHIAIALRKKIVLMNNIFNPHEFDLMNRGRIIQPSVNCDCYYRPTCVHGQSCMDKISYEKIFNAVTEIIPTSRNGD